MTHIESINEQGETRRERSNEMRTHLANDLLYGVRFDHFTRLAGHVDDFAIEVFDGKLEPLLKMKRRQRKM